MANDQSPTLGVDVPIQTRVHISIEALDEEIARLGPRRRTLDIFRSGFSSSGVPRYVTAMSQMADDDRP